MAITPQQIREAELPRGFRGFAEQPTEELLENAASSLAAALAEGDALRRQLDELGSAEEESPSDAEVIGAALVTANRFAEKLLAEAREGIDRLNAETEAEARELVRRAELEARTHFADADRRLAELRAQEESLRATIRERRQELAAFIRAAVAQLVDADEGFEDSNDYGQLQIVLHDRLHDASNGATAGDAAEPAEATDEQYF
jgi:cell division septum initiation protein DivIVA